jgi:hypothetical protein
MWVQIPLLLHHAVFRIGYSIPFGSAGSKLKTKGYLARWRNGKRPEPTPKKSSSSIWWKLGSACRATHTWMQVRILPLLRKKHKIEFPYLVRDGF